MDFSDQSFLTGEPAYSAGDKKQRDDFVKEYLRDHNSYAACVRMGFMDEAALAMAKALMEEPYVRRAIMQANETRCAWLRPEGEDEAQALQESSITHTEAYDKQRILSALLQEAHYKGPGSSHASRVSALGKLADIYGLTRKEEKKQTTSSNVMVVPATSSVDDWEANAKGQQEELKRTVKE